MEVVRITGNKGIIRLTVTNPNGPESYTEFPIELIFRFLEADFNDRLRVIQEYYDTQIQEQNPGQFVGINETVMVCVDPVYLLFCNHTDPSRVIFEIGNSIHLNALTIGICIGNPNREGSEYDNPRYSTEQIHIWDENLDIKRPDSIEFGYEFLGSDSEEDLPPNIFNRTAQDPENQVSFEFVNVDGNFRTGPCRAQSYEEALEIYEKSTLKKLLDFFASFRSLMDKA